DTILEVSRDGSYALVGETHISDGGLYAYKPGQGITNHSSLYDNNLYQSGYSVQAISTESDLIVQSAAHISNTYFGGARLIVRDASLNFKIDLTSLHPEFGGF